MFIFFIVLSTLSGIIGVGGTFSYLYLMNRSWISEIIYEKMFVRCFYLTLISLCVFIASFIAYCSS